MREARFTDEQMVIILLEENGNAPPEIRESSLVSDQILLEESSCADSFFSDSPIYLRE